MISFFPKKDPSPPHLSPPELSPVALYDTVLSSAASSSAVLLFVAAFGWRVIERLTGQERTVALGWHVVQPLPRQERRGDFRQRVVCQGVVRLCPRLEHGPPRLLATLPMVILVLLLLRGEGDLLLVLFLLRG